MSYETRPQTYDETIKLLEKKDYKGNSRIHTAGNKKGKKHFPGTYPTFHSGYEGNGLFSKGYHRARGLYFTYRI